MAALGLGCCARASSGCSRAEAACRRRAQASHCACFSRCGTGAQSPLGMWDLSRPGIKPLSPALAGGFLTTRPPEEKP